MIRFIKPPKSVYFLHYLLHCRLLGRRVRSGCWKLPEEGSVWKTCGDAIKWTASAGLLWMHCLTLGCDTQNEPWAALCVTHTPPSVQQTSAVGPWPDLWIEYWHKVIQSAQNSPVYRQHSSHHQPPALIFTPDLWRMPPHPCCRTPLSLYFFLCWGRQ